jgi:hypothetical protein
VAVQTITLVPGTPFNPTTNPIDFVLSASGFFAVDRATQVGNTIDLTVPSAQFKGTLPSFLGSIPFDLEAGSPGLNPTTGAITNVVQNPNSPGYATGSPSSFVSGDFTVNSYFELVLANGVTIVSDPNTAAVFTAHVTGLPFPAGTTFTSPAAVNLFLETPNGDLLIGQSSNRFVTVTPEPASTTLLAIGAVGMFLPLWRQRKESTGAKKRVRFSERTRIGR